MEFVINMDKIKVCLTTEKYEDTTLEIESMIEENGVLTIMLKRYYYDIKVDDVVSFIRCALYENETIPTLIKRYDARVLSVSYDELDYEEEVIRKTIITIPAPDNYYLPINAVDSFDNIYRIEFINDHYIFPQDIMSFDDKLAFYYRDENTGVEGEVFKLADVSFHDYDNIIGYKIEPKYALFNISQVDTYNECETADTVYRLTPNFYYIDNSVERKIIYVNELLTDSVNFFNGIYAPYNLFYYKSEDGVCHLWEDFEDYDTIGDTITEINGLSCQYTPLQKEYVYSFADFVKDNSTLKLNVGLCQNVDYKHLYQEELVSQIFTQKVKQTVIDDAPIIDMEKVKFSPYMYSGGTLVSASAVTFNLHFRVREDLEESWRYNENSENIWNTIRDYQAISSSPESGKSDMLYYLGFTDNDVQNQKMKIKKSFLRLSFYDDNNPLTQKLLYYSTIFMDSGELFGKYVKAKDELRKMGELTNRVVLTSSALTKNRLDCSFVVRDEYYTEKCSEGFNIYYFPSDVISEENSEKTIYMKVEFNHAGFGRTIPFIVCNNNQNGLSLNDYKESLYIKLKLKYIDGKYIYLVDETDKTIDIDNKNVTITFDLFEPKLTY